MNAIVQPALAEFEPMTEARLAEVLTIEQAAYDRPWTRGNFADSLGAGYQAQLLVAGGAVIGYYVAMKGVDEAHLLNITVAPVLQGRGWGWLLLRTLTRWAREQGAQWLWLEVRQSNQRALRLYERHGFRRAGERRGYYPASGGRREDALVLSLKL